jgi:5-methylcytosine-specific restriction endonuclease McrA
MATTETWHGTVNGYTYHRCRCDRCGEAKRAADRAYYEANREPFLAQRAGYKLVNRDRLNEQRREYYAKTRKERLETTRAYEKAHPEKKAAREAKRRALKRDATVEAVDYAIVLERDGMWCYLCETEIERREDVHFDHVLPLARGGEHSYANVRVAHSLCNIRKSDKTADEYLLVAV